MKIFYIGSMTDDATSKHRADALKRAGHQVTALDLQRKLAPSMSSPLTSRLHYHTGYQLLQRQVQATLAEHADTISGHDLAWIDSGELVGVGAVRFLNEHVAKTVLFNADDPTGPRDGARFRSLLKAAPLYSLCVTVRDETRDELTQLGARAIKTWRGVDEVIHAPLNSEEVEKNPYPAGISFAGTWIRGENRDEVLSHLVRSGIPVNIWGHRWNRSPKWPVLQSAWRGPALVGRAYTAALSAADACLGFISSGNRDLHTHRSLEIPYLGAVLVAQRTKDHQEMYTEGEEILMWSTPEECAAKCRFALENKSAREKIRAAARARIVALRAENQFVMNSIVESAFQ